MGRHIRVNLMVPTITTLVDGSCRSLSRDTWLTSIEYRTVGCHVDWLAKDTGNTLLGSHTYQMICLGHKATCGPRNHPALQDRFTDKLIAPPSTTSSTTTPYNQAFVVSSIMR